MNFWMIFQVFGIVSAWSAKALEDGKITITEAAELGAQLGKLLGIPTDVNIPTGNPVELPPPKSAGEEYAEDAGTEELATPDKPHPA